MTQSEADQDRICRPTHGGKHGDDLSKQVWRVLRQFFGSSHKPRAVSFATEREQKRIINSGEGRGRVGAQFQMESESKGQSSVSRPKGFLRVAQRAKPVNFSRGEARTLGGGVRACGGELPRKGKLGETLRQILACARTCIEAFLAQH